MISSAPRSRPSGRRAELTRSRRESGPLLQHGQTKTPIPSSPGWGLTMTYYPLIVSTMRVLGRRPVGSTSSLVCRGVAELRPQGTNKRALHPSIRLQPPGNFLHALPPLMAGRPDSPSGLGWSEAIATETLSQRWSNCETGAICGPCLHWIAPTKPLQGKERWQAKDGGQ